MTGNELNMLKSIVRWDGHSPRTWHVNCDGTVIPHAYVLSEMVIPHIVCDGTVIPHACVLSEMVIPHTVYDGMVIPHVIKKFLVEDL